MGNVIANLELYAALRNLDDERLLRVTLSAAKGFRLDAEFYGDVSFVRRAVELERLVRRARGSERR